MSWKQKTIKYCMKCQHNYKLYCTYYREWQDKRTVNNCEFIEVIEENDNNKNKDD